MRIDFYAAHHASFYLLMLRAVTIIVAIVLVLHGLIHLMGTVVYMQWSTIEGLPYTTTLLFGQWNVGDAGMRVFGALWVLPALGFIACAVALIAGWSWWRPVLIGVTVFSLLLTLLVGKDAYVGMLVDALILALLILGSRVVSVLTT